jgi:hypothetical protein
MMILPGRFKIDLLILPAHGPVYPPNQLCSTGIPQINSFFMTACITVRGNSPFAIPAVYARFISVALFSKDADRPPLSLNFVILIAEFVQYIF